MSGPMLGCRSTSAAGPAEVFAPCQRLLGNFGRLVSLGDTGHAEWQNMTEDFSTKNLTLIGANNDIAPLTAWSNAFIASAIPSLIKATWSFQETRIMGTVSEPLKAMRMW